MVWVPFSSLKLTNRPETITEIIRLQLLRCQSYVPAPEILLPRSPDCQNLRYRNPSNGERTKTKKLNKAFTGLSRDFGGDFVYVFFLPHKE